MGFIDDFVEFIEEYNVVGLAIAFVIGVEVNSLVNAIVEGAIMPIVGVFLPEGGWQTAAWTIMEIEFQIGHILSALINFTIIALLVFAFVRYILKKQEVKKI